MTIVTRAIPGLRRLLDVLLFALVAVSLGVVLLGRVLPLIGHPTLVVAGPSMGGAVPIGSAVILDQIPSASLAVGDVVSLRSGPDKALFTHRVTRLAERDGSLWLETKGDANATPDPSLTPADAVVGRVNLWIPYAGYLIALYSAPSGIVFVVSVGMVLLLLGISLEPQRLGDPKKPTAMVDADVHVLSLARAPASDAPFHTPGRSSARSVVRASRERRSRQAASGPTAPHRRPES